MVWVALRMAIAIDVGPVVLDDALAKEAFAMLDVDVALVAWTLLLTAILTDRAFRTVVSRWARCTEMLPLHLIDMKE